MFKKLVKLTSKRKGDGLATIIITIVLILIVIIAVPFFRKFIADTGSNTKAISDTQTKITDSLTDEAKSGADYDVNTGQIQ